MAKAKAAGARTARKPAGKASARRKGAARRGRAGKGKASPYAELLGSIKREFGAARDAIGKEVDRAVEAARSRLEEGPLVDRETLRRVEAELKDRLKDLRSGVRAAREKVAGAAREVREDERYKRAQDAALTGLHGLAASLRNLAERVEDSLDERRPHRTGEVVGGGRYDCRGCGKPVILTTRGELPACAACGGRVFRLGT